jgi:uncharacterized membrane protein
MTTRNICVDLDEIYISYTHEPLDTLLERLNAAKAKAPASVTVRMSQFDDSGDPGIRLFYEREQTSAELEQNATQEEEAERREYLRLKSKFE